MTKFLTSLPLLPADMPIVHVRPRKYKGRPGGNALFKVDVTKLRSAFLWLKANNPYYAGVEWREEAAAAWAADDVQVGTTREGDDDSGQAVPVTRTCFERWMERTEVEAMGGDFGYAIGRRLREVLGDTEAGDQAPVSDSAAAPDAWSHVRRLVAEVFQQNVLRMATALPQDVLAVALSARGILDLGLPPGGEAPDTLRAVRSLCAHECPADLLVYRAELDAIMLELSEESPEVVHAGTTASAEAGDDMGQREALLDSITAAAQEVVGGSGDASNLAGACPQQEGGTGGDDAPGSGSAGPQEGVAGGDGAPGSASAGRKVKYPRVDPPDVEDDPGQAIREDTPGYIAKAFPKLFPHGVGDYHGDNGGLRRTFRFEQWGRYAMMWHDGRFMRHTRYRYWLLGTMLRVMIPGVQQTFSALARRARTTRSSR